MLSDLFVPKETNAITKSVQAYIFHRNKKEHQIGTFHIMKFCMSFVQLTEVHWINSFLVRATYDLLLPLDNMYRSKFVETIMYCRRDGHISLDRFCFIFPGTYSMILREK